MKENTKMESKMVKAYFHGQMGLHIKDFSKPMSSMGKEHTLGQMGENTGVVENMERK